MTIVRGPRPADRFAQISNAALADGRLSFRARGVLAYLLSRPVGWATSAEALSEAATEGRDALRAALNELVEAGYLVRERHQNERGHWVSETHVTDAPLSGPAEPTTDFQASVDQQPTTDFQSSVTRTSVDQAIKEQEGDKEVKRERAARAKDATPLPDDWTPTESHVQRARDLSLDLDREATKFRAHAEDHGRISNSWNGAFTTWLMRADEYRARDGYVAPNVEAMKYETWDRDSYREWQESEFVGSYDDYCFRKRKGWL